MFIAPATQRSLRSGGAKCLNLLDIDGAPSEREALINQNYKHLAAPAAMAPTITANFRNRTLENVRTVPGRVSAVQQILARRGWFIPPEVPAMAFLNLVEEHNAAGRMKDSWMI